MAILVVMFFIDKLQSVLFFLLLLVLCTFKQVYLINSTYHYNIIKKVSNWLNYFCLVLKNMITISASIFCLEVHSLVLNFVFLQFVY